MRDQAASDRLIQSSRALLILARSAPGTSFSEFVLCVHVCEQAQLLFLNPLSAESSPFSGLIGSSLHGAFFWGGPIFFVTCYRFTSPILERWHELVGLCDVGGSDHS